ncbi:MAG: GNAT family N-acetyltransferase [Janthinobacterium lividum]
MTDRVAPPDVDTLESIEAAAWADSYRSQPKPSPYRLETTVGPHGVALLGLTSIPWTEFNRAIGFTSEAALSRSAIEAIRRWLQDNAASCWALQLPDPMLDAALLATFRDAGLERRGRDLAKLRRGLGDPGDGSATTVEIREVGTDRSSDFAQTVQVGFGAPPLLAETFMTLPGRAGWRTYVAYDGDLPIACGALFIQGSLAWLGIGATRPEWRGRGAQSALIRRRIRDGLAAGVRTFTAETGVPVPGQERNAVSFNNLRRAGFELAYKRGNFGPAVAAG